MPKAKVEWVVIGGTPDEIGHCTRCGEGLRLNLPQNIKVVVAASKAFVKVHARCKPGKYIEPATTTPEAWLAGRDTGLSSKTIWHVMRRIHCDRPSPPSDPADFGRCYRLLKLFPAWRNRLPEVAELYQEWSGLINNWDELTRLYEEELPFGTAPKLYVRMKELLAEEWHA